MPTPFADCGHELLDGFVFRPEVTMQNRRVGYRSCTLLDRQLFSGRVSGGGVGDNDRRLRLFASTFMAVRLSQGITSST